MTRTWCSALILPGLLFGSLAGCGPAPIADTAPSPSASAASPEASAAATADPSGAAFTDVPPTRGECDAFMNVIALTTTLRASIHRDAATAARAQDWATRTAQLAESAKALHLTHPDLAAESANLAGRMSDLARELRALAAAENGTDEAVKIAAHNRVIHTSEQVEVITHEPAARCAGDTRSLHPIAGRLPPAKIQTVVRSNFPKLRACYEDGLRRNPTLQGRVAVRFVIGREGKVTEAHDATSDPIPTDATAPAGASTTPPMPDKKVSACVVSRMLELVFPKPEGGVVTVVYPINFSAAE